MIRLQAPLSHFKIGKRLWLHKKRTPVERRCSFTLGGPGAGLPICERAKKVALKI